MLPEDQISMNQEVVTHNLFDYVSKTLEFRIHSCLSMEKREGEGEATDEPDTSFGFECELEYLTAYIEREGLNLADAIALTLALMPHLSPALLQTASLLADGNPTAQTLLGGAKAKYHQALIPTGETLLFCLAGTDAAHRRFYYDYFLNDSVLFTQGVLELEVLQDGEPRMSGRLIVSEDYVDYFMTGRFSSPKLSAHFPASRIETKLVWENLVLKERTMNQIQEISSWLEHDQLVMRTWGMETKLKPGYRVMFYGPPGTGKTLTASLLGKYTGKDVYRIDLSLIVSKYIGETEKNLARLFDKAANKDWILFFDEADSIFGKRTSVKDAHDKYANQEVSYLLQRIEVHPGLVIIATNLKNNIDAAFTRRFHSIIEFEQPGEAERLKIWKEYIPEALDLDEGVSLEQLSKLYHLTGSNILNIVQYACLKTADKKTTVLTQDVLIDGIRKEYAKEGRVFQ